tara:strand:- start:8111 stop:8860 length:750 start_codon:yes stop_codon:yes gene_type:complete
MGLFSMLESAFFITLGISCVLLLMLIYHFKQRVTKLEKSNETTFEIMNNMVQEISSLKMTMQSMVPVTNIDNYEYPNGSFQKVNVSLNETDSVNDELTDDSSEEEETDSENEEDNNEQDSSDDEEQDEEEDGEDEDEESVQNDIKVVNVEVDENLDADQFIEDVVENDELNENDELVEIDTDKLEDIQINKLEAMKTLEEPVNTDIINKKEVYKKMNVPTLKALVIEKGLASEVSKLKKNDLIQLLESN